MGFPPLARLEGGLRGEALPLYPCLFSESMVARETTTSCWLAVCLDRCCVGRHPRVLPGGFSCSLRLSGGERAHVERGTFARVEDQSDRVVGALGLADAAAHAGLPRDV